MPRSTLNFGADTSELDGAFGRLDDQLASFAANVDAMSAAIGANSRNARQQDAGDDAAYWQNMVEQARAASSARMELDQAGLAAHRATARQWSQIDGEIGRDFSDVVMAAITNRRGGIGAALADVVRRGLSDALSSIGRGLAGQLQSALGLGDISPSGLIGSLFGSGGTDVGTAAMTQLNATMASMGLVTEGLDVTTAANTLATTANTAAEGAGGAGGALGLAGLLGFAGGGRPPTGLPSLVGERGPELFLPDVAGTVIPNGGWGLRGAGSFGTSTSGGDFAPSISMPMAFHGGTPGMSKPSSAGCWAPTWIIWSASFGTCTATEHAPDEPGIFPDAAGPVLVGAQEAGAVDAGGEARLRPRCPRGALRLAALVVRADVPGAARG